jgi:hypothetical protein
MPGLIAAVLSNRSRAANQKLVIRFLIEFCAEGRYLRRKWFPVAGQHGRKQRGHGTQSEERTVQA